MPWGTLSDSTIQIFAGLLVLVGVVSCFFGYRIFKVFLALVGFAIGFIVARGGVELGGSYAAENILIPVLVGLVGAALLYALYYLGIFVLGALLGAALGAMFVFKDGGDGAGIVLLVMALIGGVVAVVLHKVVIVVATAFLGAVFMVSGVRTLMGDTAIRQVQQALSSAGSARAYEHVQASLTKEVVALVIILGLTVAGIVVQYSGQKRSERKPAPPAPEAPKTLGC